jgi:hypothetical protein
LYILKLIAWSGDCRFPLSSQPFPLFLSFHFFTNNRTKSSQTSYLLFRQGNAFAATITPPARLRRWTAAFFAAFALNHVWYMPVFFLSSSDRYGLLP